MYLSLPRFDRARILVVGDVMLDRYWHGPTARISPEAPVPVVRVEQIEDRPGGAANVALNIAALNGHATIAGLVGADEAAAALIKKLGETHIDSLFQTIPTHPTITKLRVISRHQQLLRLDFEERFAAADAQQLVDTVLPCIGDFDALVLSDYAKGALADPQPLIAAAKKLGIPVLVDPKGSDFRRYRGATLLTPNLHEFEAIVGSCPNDEELVRCGQTLMLECELDALLVTRGEHGMTLLQRDQPALHLPAQAREVFDVTGAGDTVISVLAAALAAGSPLADAVALANTAAGIVVGKLGTAAVSAPELRRALQREHGGDRGVMTLPALEIAVADARAHGERIVFTNGCFDILHAGHVTYLEQAKMQGDRLIVAINDDASVSRLKGPSRPINGVEGRMAVLAGLEAVDWVVSFAEDTPNVLLRALRPDILVKGGDYREDQVVGREIVKEYGGEVRVLSLVKGVSTTGVVEKIKKG
jgi:D-beta-D-heptose 7-phosphate kinase/D-beta-D-heptose 1-phosphate adenosyltransferase